MQATTDIARNSARERVLECGDLRLDLSRPRVMGILNITPDSFSDGGVFFAPETAVARALHMAGEGAAIIDVGGESTRPGATAVSEAEEIGRVVPVIRAIRAAVPAAVISVDTSKSAVMRAAVAAGAGLINDVRALREPGALEAARELGVPVCLMHMQGEPRTMQQAPHYGDVVREVMEFLAARIDACLRAGIPRTRLLVDPGFGFGKTTQQRIVSTNVEEVIRAIVDLGGTYPDVVQMLEQAKESGALESRFRVNALPEVGRELVIRNRGEDGEEDPEVEPASYQIETPEPELFGGDKG